MAPQPLSPEPQPEPHAAEGGEPRGVGDPDRGSAAEEIRPSFADALSTAAARSGFAKVAPGETPSAGALLSAVGGVRGLIESILPGLGFLVVYTISHDVLWSVLAPLALAVVFVVVRIVSRSPVAPAVVGLLGIAVSAVLALITGRAEENFLPGFVINAVAILVLLISLIVRRPLIGVIVGLLSNDLESWRTDRARRRIATVATWLWIGLFVLRLAVEVPLYLASNTAWLAAMRLLLGVPPYAALLWVTWLLVRSVTRRKYLDVETVRPPEG